MASFIEIRELTKRYKEENTYALKNASATFENGKIYSLIGRSGAGKSTLLRCLNGLELPDSGSISVDEHDFLSVSRSQQQQILRKIGTVFQQFNLLNNRTVIENIALPLLWMGLTQKEAQARAAKLAQHVLLEDKLNYYPGQLSGGQKQRVAIARALATEPKLLLCDEFTSALDRETILEILSLLRDLNQRLGVMLILITHDMWVVREISDWVYVMDAGHIVEYGSIDRIMLAPQHKITQSLIQGLFLIELPNHIQKQLLPQPSENCLVILRLIFSGSSALQPVIADLIRMYNLPVTILAGNLDHIREAAFGCLIIGFPYYSEKLALSLSHFQKYQMTSEIIGYLAQ
jgi:D-methionine transport system ATP-binding protein